MSGTRAQRSEMWNGPLFVTTRTGGPPLRIGERAHLAVRHAMVVPVGAAGLAPPPVLLGAGQGMLDPGVVQPICGPIRVLSGEQGRRERSENEARGQNEPEGGTLGDPQKGNAKRRRWRGF